jgi:hypothetical protein
MRVVKSITIRTGPALLRDIIRRRTMARLMVDLVVVDLVYLFRHPRLAPQDFLRSPPWVGPTGSHRSGPAFIQEEVIHTQMHIRTHLLLIMSNSGEPLPRICMDMDIQAGMEEEGDHHRRIITNPTAEWA